MATSSTIRRAWTIGGERRTTSSTPPPAARRTDLASVSVVAATAWEAEVLAKAGFLAGAERCLTTVRQAGGAALAVTVHGDVLSSPPFTSGAPDAFGATTWRGRADVRRVDLVHRPRPPAWWRGPFSPSP